MKEFDIQEQDIQYLRRKCNDPIPNWVWVVVAGLIAAIIYLTN